MMGTTGVLRVGTRPSMMAMVQAQQVAVALAALAPDASVEVVKVTTSGDRRSAGTPVFGGKEVWVREIDDQQLAGKVDVAVHCLKDMPSDLADGLTIAAYLPREDPYDALVTRDGKEIGERSRHVVGTSSMRRAAQLRARWKELRVQPVSGNADTRLRMLDDGRYDALVLGVAGLRRIGAADRIAKIFTSDLMLPAVGAGVIAVTTRGDDPATQALVTRLDDPTTRRVATAERVMLQRLGGTCRSAIAGLARPEDDGGLRLRAAVYHPAGPKIVETLEWGSGDGTSLGEQAADALLRRGARALLDAPGDVG